MDRVLFALSVPKCVCCGRRLVYGEKAFCLKCSADFEDFKNRECSHCARPLYQCDCSNEFLRSHYVKRVIKCYRYLVRDEKLTGNRLIYSLKRDHRSDVLDIAAAELIKAINYSVDNPSKYIFTNVPRRRRAIVEFGYDHSELLAKEISKHFGAEYISMLGSNAKYAQKTLETEERFKNADFYLKSDIDLTGRGVIIIDDIITTGASVGKSASLIRSLGSKDIIAAALGIAYKDS